ncbi:MAG: hypothetical protein M1839_005506 [Geoglossum umbratile]|nr:MAG: hypothetical protein M1839_005506 [Geoglossum umbratile]
MFNNPRHKVSQTCYYSTVEPERGHVLFKMSRGPEDVNGIRAKRIYIYPLFECNSPPSTLIFRPPAPEVMASSNEIPKTVSTSSTLYSEYQFKILACSEDAVTAAGSPDSLGIGPKGKTSFPCLDDFSESTTLVAGSSPPEPHSPQADQHFLCAVYRQPNSSQDVQFPEGEYPASRDFRNRSTGNEEFKMVDEIWDQSANKYKIVEPPGSPDPFVVNRRFGKPNTKPESSIDIKSEGLRAIVLQALEYGNNALAYSRLDVLLECFPQLEVCLAIYTGFTSATPRKRTDTPGEYLKKLVEFLKSLREIDTPPTTRTGEVDLLSVMIPAEGAPQSLFVFEDTMGKLSES